MLWRSNEFFDRGVSKWCKRVGKGLLIADLALVLSANAYHYTKSTNETGEAFGNDITLLHSRINSKISQYNSAVGEFLLGRSEDLRSYFPDDLSFECFVKLLKNTKRNDDTVCMYYYGYLLGLYAELGAPKLDTTRCLLNRLWLDCPHATVSTICFHGHKVTESVFLAELSHHVQFEKHVGKSALMLISDAVRIYHDPRRWYDKCMYNLDIYTTLYDEPGSFEFEAHLTIEPQLRHQVFTAVADFLCADSAYLEQAKSDIHAHAQAIAAIAGGVFDREQGGQEATMGTWSLEQLYTNYWFVRYLPKDNPFRVYMSSEIKRFYLRHLYFVCTSENPNHKNLFMGNSIYLVEFGNYFNLTVMEEQEVIKALKHLTTHF